VTKKDMKEIYFIEQLKKIRSAGTPATIKTKIEKLWARAEVVATQANAVVNPRD